MAEAIVRDPLAAVRALHAARAADDDQEFGVKERFAAVMADPALGPQASEFEPGRWLWLAAGAGTAPAEAIVKREVVSGPCRTCAPCRRLPAAAACRRPVNTVLVPLTLRQVPILTEETADQLPNHCLVRYRGMVRGQLLGRLLRHMSSRRFSCRRRRCSVRSRPPVCARPPASHLQSRPLPCTQVADMLNPEYYVGEYRRPDGTWATAKFADQVRSRVGWEGVGVGSERIGDTSIAYLGTGGRQGKSDTASKAPPHLPCCLCPLLPQLDEAVPEGGETRIAERRPLLLVPVPAESGWAGAPHAAAARASLMALQAGAGAAAGAASKRPREDGAPAGGAEDDVSISMMVSDATGQTAADDGDSAASRARRAAGAPAGQQQEASSGSGAAAAGADLPAGSCMVYVSAGDGAGRGWLCNIRVVCLLCFPRRKMLQSIWLEGRPRRALQACAMQRGGLGSPMPAIHCTLVLTSTRCSFDMCFDNDPLLFRTCAAL